jgi:NADPH:quinone reductase-like Zn-dependent oxidoreductase
MAKVVRAGGRDVGEAAAPANLDLVIGADEVLVSMEAPSINPVDFLLASGWYDGPPTEEQEDGSERVGRVLEVGAAVDGDLLGRRVIAMMPHGQAAEPEVVVVPTRNIVAVSDEVATELGGTRGDAVMFACNPRAGLAVHRSAKKVDDRGRGREGFGHA